MRVFRIHFRYMIEGPLDHTVLFSSFYALRVPFLGSSSFILWAETIWKNNLLLHLSIVFCCNMLQLPGTETGCINSRGYFDDYCGSSTFDLCVCVRCIYISNVLKPRRMPIFYSAYLFTVGTMPLKVRWLVFLPFLPGFFCSEATDAVSREEWYRDQPPISLVSSWTANL